MRTEIVRRRSLGSSQGGCDSVREHSKSHSSVHAVPQLYFGKVRLEIRSWPEHRAEGGVPEQAPNANGKMVPETSKSLRKI